MTVNRIIDAVRVRDQLGKPDSTAIFGPFRKAEQVRIDDQTKAYKKIMNDSFILGHTTLGRLRTDRNFEADCSDNGNHGTWNGSDIDGDQYVKPAWMDSIGSWKLQTQLTDSSRVVPDVSYTGLYGTANDGEFKINASAYYPFNGNANDESVNSNDGTVTGATLTTDHLGNENNAYSFDGDNDYVSFGSDSSIDLDGSSFSINVWVKRGIIDTEGYILNKGQITSIDASLHLVFKSNNDVRFGFYSDDLDSDKKIDDTNWHMLTFVYDSSTKTKSIYIDGVFDKSAVGAASLSGSDAYNLVLGRREFGSIGGYFEGIIDDVLVVRSVALSADEVLNLYNVTSVHKLDKPLVTKTDSDGNSITGFEFVQLGGAGPEVETDSNFPLNLTTEDYAVFCEFMLNYAEDTTTNQALIFGTFPEFGLSAKYTSATNYYLQAWYGGNAGTSTASLEFGKRYRAIIQYHANSNTREIYVDNSLYDTKTGGTPTDYNLPLHIGHDSSYPSYNVDTTGVISKPVIINKVLTETERDYLFENGNIEEAYPVQRLSAGSFNGTDNVVQGPNADVVVPDTDSFTIYGSFIADVIAAPDRVFTFRQAAGASNVYGQMLDEGAFRIRYKNSSNAWVEFKQPVVVGTVYNFMFVSDNGTEYFYLNEVTDTNSNGVYPMGSVTMAVGGFKDGGGASGDHFDGIIDEFMVFDTPCSSQDYEDFRNNKFYSNHSQYANCVLWWSFDDPRLGDRRSSQFLVQQTNN